MLVVYNVGNCIWLVGNKLKVTTVFIDSLNSIINRPQNVCVILLSTRHTVLSVLLRVFGAKNSLLKPYYLSGNTNATISLQQQCWPIQSLIACHPVSNTWLILKAFFWQKYTRCMIHLCERYIKYQTFVVGVIKPKDSKTFLVWCIINKVNKNNQ